MNRFAMFDYVVYTNNYRHIVHTTDKQAAISSVLALEMASGINFTKIKKVLVEVGDKWVEC